jgi:sRNA-binding carbon storage regulator CsrA
VKVAIAAPNEKGVTRRNGIRKRIQKEKDKSLSRPLANGKGFLLVIATSY